MLVKESAIHWGNRLRTLLKQQKNLKQLALANAIGVEESTISRWLSGGNIKVAHLVTLCEFLDVSVDWLIMGRGSPILHKSLMEERDPLTALPQDVRDDIRNLVKKLSTNSHEAESQF